MACCPPAAGPGSTCPIPPPVAGLAQPAVEWLAGVGGVSRQSLIDHSYIHEDSAAARHAFRVASGLDGSRRPQILSQMKQAVHEAEVAGTRWATLHQLFQRSFAVARRCTARPRSGPIRSAWRRRRCALAAQLFEDLSEGEVLFVGAGEMIDLVATHFAARTPARDGRRQPHARARQAPRRRLGAGQVRLAELPQRLADFDVVISCTASSLPIIGLGAVGARAQEAPRRPMFMVDLAVPRDIEPGSPD